MSEKMTQKELMRAICNECRKNGVRISQPKMKKVIRSIRNVVFKACLEEKEVRLLGFVTFTPQTTRKVLMPSGNYNKQRLKIKVKLTEVFSRRVKQMAVMLRDGEIKIEDVSYDIFFEDEEVYDDEIYDDEDEE